MFNFNKPKQDLDNAIKTCPTCLGSGITTDFINEQFVTIPCTNPNCPTKEGNKNTKRCQDNDDGACIPEECNDKSCYCQPKKEAKVPLEYLEIDLAEELLEVGKVLGFASEKHNDRDGYKNGTISDMMGRIFRHLNAFNRGIEFDDESKCSHLAHAALCCLIVDYLRKKKDNG